MKCQQISWLLVFGYCLAMNDMNAHKMVAFCSSVDIELYVPSSVCSGHLLAFIDEHKIYCFQGEQFNYFPL